MDWTIWCLIVFSPLIIFLGKLLVTNIIVPNSKKKALLEQMRKRSDWPDIEKTLNILTKLFKSNHAKITSVAFRQVHHITSKEFIYGEIDFLSFHNILEKTKPQANEKFYDLGSGAGKGVFAAALYFNFSKSCGIELLEPLYNKATNMLNKANSLLQHIHPNDQTYYLNRVSTIKFIKDSFLEYDFQEANVIYVAATCLSDTTWEILIHRMAKLKPGTRIIVATKSIQHKRFEMIYQGIDIMSWGLCPVKIYKIKIV